ncbi:unnamed protein product, partial [Mesorhabditis belari]|uniref:Uncharacterized protein n=1 Tax=Mesorhabditis belari TaxID=2138241 RepID=A0AAF3J8Q4_9BILA
MPPLDENMKRRFRIYILGMTAVSFGVTLYLMTRLVLKQAEANPEVTPQAIAEPGIAIDDFLHNYLEKGEVRKVVFLPHEKKAIAVLHDGAVIGGRMSKDNVVTVATDLSAAQFWAEVRKVEDELGIPLSQGVALQLQQTIDVWRVLKLTIGMTDTMREAIAQLMGAQRAKEEGRDLPLYNHHSVCRPYLLSCCPGDLLGDTRLEGLVSCRKMHEPTHKADYENAQAQKDHFYDIELYNILQGTIRLVDGEIEKIKNKLDRDTRDAGESAEIVKMKRIADIEEQIKLLVGEIEELGSQGKVEESMRTAKKVEELEQKKNELKNEGKMNIPMTSQQRLRVCDDCGAQLNIMDHESRLADHFGGKMHLGMVEIREPYTEMGSTIDERRKLYGEKNGDSGRETL